MEQRERSFTPRLPAGSHSPLENQVSVLNERPLEVKTCQESHTLSQGASSAYLMGFCLFVGGGGGGGGGISKRLIISIVFE